MLHVGIGETQVNNLFSTMNVHYPHHKTSKTRENEVGNVMERQATNSDNKSLLDEAFQAMTIDAEDNENTETDNGIKISTDTCWQKKGSGRSYDSLSAPKYKHYSGSSSLGYRVSTAVSQKNEGYNYISEVNESAGLSPGNMTIKKATLLDKRRAKNLEKSSTRKFKTERKRLKKMKLAKNSRLEIREGKTYESEIGMNEQNVDEIEIPETTGLQRTSDIIQLAAYSENNQFSSYIMQNRPISSGASEVTKISVIGSQMYHDLQAVPSKLQNKAFTDFNDFVKSFPVKPLLVGHNIKRFDCHVFSQTALVDELLGETYSAHNAVDDTKVLYRLVQSKGNIKGNMQALVFSENYPKEFSRQQDNLKTFTDAIICKAISRTLALKASRSNFRLEQLSIAVKRNGLDGLKSVLSEQTNQGNVRVTTNKKAILKIFDFLTRES
ncbi:unnamed protein product [Mytilus coruscus]|uniref:Exonuclease domain-containing protein n=1 Tax=Mytilus coruscus TaxID=42192 RepID=A0A6J8D3U9_MYTCO|nr:unnamed protein product [Mytilus coruscus]